MKSLLSETKALPVQMTGVLCSGGNQVRVKNHLFVEARIVDGCLELRVR
jgi:hypothetical protein